MDGWLGLGGTLLGGALTLLGGHWSDRRARSAEGAAQVALRAAAARTWRDDFYVAQEYLAEALAVGDWPEERTAPAPNLGTAEQLMLLVPELKGHQWPKITKGRRLALRLVFTSTRPRFDAGVARDAFLQLERGREELCGKPLDEAWVYHPHPNLEAVEAGGT